MSRAPSPSLATSGSQCLRYRLVRTGSQCLRRDVHGPLPARASLFPDVPAAQAFDVRRSYTECSSATSVVMPSVSVPESSWTSHLHVPCHWRLLNCTVPSRSTRHDSGRAVRRTHPDRSAAKVASTCLVHKSLRLGRGKSGPRYSASPPRDTSGRLKERPCLCSSKRSPMNSSISGCPV